MIKHPIRTVQLALSVSVLATAALPAKLTLAYPLADHALIQAGRTLVLRGTAEANVAVSVALAGKHHHARADSSGAWRARIPPLKASYRPLTLTVTAGRESVARKDLLVGELWVATGQSNMQWPLNRTKGGKRALVSSPDPHLRFLHHSGTLHPDGKKYPRAFLTKLNQANYYHSPGWQTCTTESAANFSAVAYFFAKKLRKQLDVPVGIIALPVGGSPIEAHMPEDAFASDPKLKPLLKDWWKNPDYPQWCRQRAALNLTHWLADPEPGKDPPHPFAPTFLWQAGIEPLLNFPVKGVIWYQGESNATVDGGGGKAVPKEINHRKLVALVRAYRRHWDNKNLPFYHVQLPGLNRNWTLFREMQSDVTRELDHVGMAVAIDVGHPTDVHPRNKKPVGERLARLALHNTYGKAVPCRGPAPGKITRAGSFVTVAFSHADGLTTADKQPPRTFELAGADGIFHPARAKITRHSVTLASGRVAVPLSIRYAWANDPDVNLVNGADLPAAPFRAPVEQ